MLHKSRKKKKKDLVAYRLYCWYVKSFIKAEKNSFILYLINRNIKKDKKERT